MSALAQGVAAPDFQLQTLQGEPFSMKKALGSGPVVLVFFKVSCPTCQYSLPFYERLFTAYGNRHIRLVGIAQDNAADTAAFAREFGITFPLLLDDTRTYPASNAYGLTNVPSIFWVDPDGQIAISSVGWSKPDFETINRRMAEIGAIAAASLFRPGEEVRDFRAG